MISAHSADNIPLAEDLLSFGTFLQAHVDNARKRPLAKSKPARPCRIP